MIDRSYCRACLFIEMLSKILCTPMKTKNGDTGLVGPFRMGQVRPAGQRAPLIFGFRGDWKF